MAPSPYELPDREAIAWFRRKLNLPGVDSQAAFDEINDFAFYLSGATSAQLLTEIRTLVEALMVGGTTFEKFAQDFVETSKRMGWTGGTATRASLVASANVRSAYAAGRWQRMTSDRAIARRPYWRWSHRDSPDPRRHHEAMDGRVFEASAVMAAGLSLPSGFGCRCTWVPVRDPGPNGPTPLPDTTITHIHRRTGRRRTVPAIADENGKLQPLADPGWTVPPGTVPTDARSALLREMYAALPPDLVAQLPPLPLP